ncbi:hypothetical protein SAMN05428952_11031 [Nitrosomonas sp. Nm132]|nr:hypothetical protein SAMN05428952_11031 [Nitrosomonas sp. Nm132]
MMITRKNSWVLYLLGFILACCTQSRLFAQDAVGTLIQSVDLSCFTRPNCPDPNTMNPGAISSPDPSSIAYLSAGPRAGHLLIGDGEVDEMDWLFNNQNVNAFETTLTGELLAGSNTTSYTDEPAGMAFNPLNLHIFISDDTIRQILEINPGTDSVFGTADDTVVGSINTRDFNSTDPEGLAYDHIEGALYLADGLNAEIYKILPGPNGRFNGAPPSGDDVVTSFDTLSLGVEDPEGIEWDPATGNLYIVGKPPTRVAEVTTSGALVRMIDISAANANKPAGLALGAWSGVGSDPYPTVQNLYIVDRGVDNNEDPHENDGKLYEFAIPWSPSGGGPAGNQRPNLSAGADQVITFTSSCSGSTVRPCATLNGIVMDDGLPNPPAQLAINWSVVSGPGAVVLGNSSAAEATASFSEEGVYVLRLTADDSELSTSDEVQITVLPPPPPLAAVYVTTSRKSSTLGNLSFGREDILRYDIHTDSWSLYFDGSHAGLGSTDINGFHLLADGSILLTFQAVTLVPGVGSVDTMDIVRFIPASLGENNTTGTFEWYFKGANVGLGPSSQASGERIDALSFLPDGRLLVSTSGNFSVPGVSGGDEDLIAFTATSLGETTSGAWQLYFDGSKISLSDGGDDEDVDGVSVDSTGNLYLTTNANFSVPGASGDGADIFRCIPPQSTPLPIAKCTYDPVWSGSAHGLAGQNVNGIDLVFGTAGNSAPSVTIDTPANNATFMAGEAVTFTGTAADSEDGSLTSALAWSSSLDGALGNGGTVNTSSLSVGTHVITASVSDSGGLAGSHSISVTINP